MKKYTADVKCYYCGHVSGQLVGTMQGRMHPGDFVPRPGYTRPLPRPGEALRCERCRGPVYLEDFRTVKERPGADRL